MSRSDIKEILTIPRQPALTHFHQERSSNLQFQTSSGRKGQENYESKLLKIKRSKLKEEGPKQRNINYLGTK